MATVNAEMRAPFTYVWTIENFSDLTYIDLKIPSFVIKGLGDTVWHLKIDEYVDFYCHIQTNDYSVEKSEEIDFEFSFLAADGSPLVSKRNSKSRWFLQLLTRAAFLERRDEFMPNNTLTVQCRMWRRGHEIPSTDVCYARTRLKTDAVSFVWAVEEFGALKSSATVDFGQLAPDERRIFPLKPLTEKGPFMALVLYLKRNSKSEDVYVDFLIEEGRDYAFSCELSVLGVNGEVVKSNVKRGRTHYSWTFLRFWPLISKNELNSSKNSLLSNDTLLLRCSFEVCTGVISSDIEYCTPNASSFVEEEEKVLDFYATLMDAGDSLVFEDYFVQEGKNSAFVDHSVKAKNDLDSCTELCPLGGMLRYLESEVC